MDNRLSYLYQILQTEPVFHNEYLSEILRLPVNSEITTKRTIEDRTTDTTRIIRLF